MNLAIPDRINMDWLENFYRGMAELSSKFEVSILGGDSTKSLTDLIINIAVTGISKSGETLFRSGAQSGDIIVVSGYLGDSSGGLELLLNSRRCSRYCSVPSNQRSSQSNPTSSSGPFISPIKRL